MIIRFSIFCVALAGCCALVQGQGTTKAPRATVVRTCTLPRLSLSQFGNPAITANALERAGRNGLKFTDLPSIGSGLAAAGENEFWGITDRGPNGTIGKGADRRRTFPLPEFCPSIVRVKLVANRIELVQSILLRDRQGRLISGLSNLPEDERLDESALSATHLALDPNGVDPEAIRVLPDGRFLLSEEYSPSLLVVGTNGQVLVRYTPVSKPLTNAAYPVQAILPAVFAQRRVNHGFENLAVTPDGRFAYVILQGPMGDARKKRFADSRVIRALKLDITEPLAARVVGEYLVLASPAADYSATQAQDKLGWSDADCIAPDQLLVVERGKGLAKLLLVDLRDATNILGRGDESGLGFEDVSADLSTLGVRAASAREIFSTRDLPAIDSDKIEGVAVLGPTEIALSNDNDFGIGENTTGEPSRIWIVRLAEPLPLSRAK